MMKKFAPLLLLLGTFAQSTCAHAKASSNIGLNYSFDDVFGLHYEFDVSKAVSNAPVSAQFFYKNYSQYPGGNARWHTTGVGAAGIYDLGAAAKLGKKLRPYVGLGLMSVSHTWAGVGPTVNYSGVTSGFYVTGGVRYALSTGIDTDVNFNNFGGLTLGVNFNF